MNELLSDLDQKTLNRLHRELSIELMKSRIRKAKRVRRAAGDKSVPFSIAGGKSSSVEIG